MNAGQFRHGVLTTTPGSLSDDFVVNLLTWAQRGRRRPEAGAFESRDLSTDELKWTGNRVDLVLGSNSELRALAAVYASDDAREKFVHDFGAARTKVMNLDRFDLT